MRTQGSAAAFAGRRKGSYNEENLCMAASIRPTEMEQFVTCGRLLEIGLGSGYTLLEAQSRGRDVLGVELPSTCVADVRVSCGGPSATRALCGMSVL
jgi:hypothetical protein